MPLLKNTVRSTAWLCLLSIVLTGCVSLPFTDKLPFIGKKKASSQHKIIPKNVSINTKLGLAYLQQGDLDKAQDKLKKAIALKADYTEPHHYLAETYRQQGKASLANDEYKQALKLSPDNPSLHNNYGVFLCGTGHYTEAEEQFLIAVNNPTYASIAQAFENAGLCLLKLKDTSRSEFYFQKALQNNPKQIKALYHIAEISLTKKRTKAAKDYLNRYEKLAEPSAKTLWLAVKISTALQDKANIAHYSRQLIEEFKDSKEYQQLTGLDTIHSDEANTDDNESFAADNASSNSNENTGFTDTATEDSGFEDAGFADTATKDSGFEDSGFEDSGFEDSGVTDTATKDSGFEDTGVADNADAENKQHAVNSGFGDDTSKAVSTNEISDEASKSIDAALKNMPKTDSASPNEVPLLNNETRPNTEKSLLASPLEDNNEQGNYINNLLPLMLPDPVLDRHIQSQ